MSLRRSVLPILLAGFLLLTSAVSSAQTLDQYGGYVDVPALGGATGFFRVEKLGNSWVFVSPAGNAFWMLGVFGLDNSGSIPDQGISYDQIVALKYPDKQTWANQSLKRMSSWGFNTVAEYASAYAYPFGRPAGAFLVPMASGMRPSWYGLTNSGSYAPGPFKSLEDCLDLSVFTGWLADGPPDVFDPNFDAYVNGLLSATRNDPFWSQLLTSPWMIGMATDDADQLQGFGPGLQVPGQDGYVSVHIGWLALAASPSKGSSSRYGVTYTDPTVFTKVALHDFLVAKYGSINALNAAWGSNYTTFDSAGGWGVGTGLMDENGRHTAWLGGTDGTLRNAAPAVVADLDAFLYQYAAQYFSITAGRLRQYAPNHLVFGPAVLNGHGGLTRAPILRAAGQYLDVIQVGITDQQLLDLTAQYVGDKPLVTWEGSPANPDSSLWRYPNPGFGSSTQADRGLWYATKINSLLTAQTSTGSRPIVGFKWWAWSDSWGEKTNWGLVSFRDNAYNGKEAVVALGTDPWGYPTGGEELNYGDFLTPVTTANAQVHNQLLSTISTGTTSSTSTSSGTTSSTTTTSTSSGTTSTGTTSPTTDPIVTTTVSSSPTVSILQPVDGDSLARKSTVAIVADASSDVGITSVQFYINGSLRCSVATAPYTCNWKVPGATGRTYELQAIANDSQGNVGTSGIVNVISK